MLRFAVSVLVAGALVGCGGEEEPSAVPVIVAREVADAEALARLRDWQGLPVLGDGVYRMQSSEDRRTGWQPPIALWSHDNRDFNNFVCRGRETGAEPAEVSYVFDLPACPEDYVRGAVMARFEGAGRLARLWLTAASIRAAAPDREVVRIYVDDGEAPVVQAPLAEMLAGGGHEIFAPPFGAGSRRYLAWHYPVVFDDKLIVSIDRLGARDLYFHQVSVVQGEGRRVAASRRLAERDGVKRFLRGGAPSSAPARRVRLVLEPGARSEVVHRGPATIVSATLGSHSASTLGRGVAVRVFWDDQPEPAIDMALEDLFAVWSKPASRPSMALAALGDGVSLRLPMPFARRARWVFHNTGDAAAELSLTYEVAPGVPMGTWGHLHAQAHHTGGAQDRMHELAAATGRGRLVGTCVAMRGHGLVERGRPGHPFHFLEGDELGIVDGERALAGTGTEDYFDGAFYFEDGAAGTPFAQVWDITPRIPQTRQGRVSTCRWHVLGDEIDFRESLDLKLEIGPGVPEVLDEYRSVTFLYSREPG